MNESERQYELKHLEILSQKILFQLDSKKESLQGSRGELQNALSAFWENQSANYWDQAQQAEAVDRQRSLTAAIYQRQARLRKMAESPYFGRIDFLENKPNQALKPEQIYIGIASLVDAETGEYLIYDWRSPVAGMFYDYEPGPAEYQCPAGIVAGELTLKRQYQIEHGRILSMFDTDLKIDDEILQEILDRNTDIKMRTIVNSIQREQNRIIRDENHRLLIVQGPAGSGKTSIALHRAAYLLYLKRNMMTAKNILILSPNRIFSDYISEVLPQLGEENVRQTTFQDYIVSFKSCFPAKCEERDTQLEYLLSATPNDPKYSIRQAAIRYKTDPDFMTLIRNYLNFLNEYLVKDCPTFEFRGQTILSAKEWGTLYRENLAYLSPTERLSQIRHRVQVKLRPFIYELRQEKELAIAANGEEVNEKTIKALARLAAKKELEPLIVQLNHFTTLEPFTLYRRLFEDEELSHCLTAETKLPQEWQEIRKQTTDWFNQGIIPYEDMLPLIFFQGSLAGFSVKNDIRHLIIDEAQDYTIFQYEILKRLFPDCSWTILGDLNQSVHPYFYEVNFSLIMKILAIDNPLLIRLNRSYRSTREIQNFCRELLDQTEIVEQVNRPGPLPEIWRSRSQASILMLIVQKIRDLQNKGYRSIAIISKTAFEAATIYEKLKDNISLTIITRESEEFYNGTLIIPIYLAKGLEFDAVLIYEASSENYSHQADRKILYIACTRALHQLFLFYSQELSPFITGMNPSLYQLYQVKDENN